MGQLKYISSKELSKIDGDKFIVNADELEVIRQYSQKFDALGLFQILQRIMNRGMLKAGSEETELKPDNPPKIREIN